MTMHEERGEKNFLAIFFELQFITSIYTKDIRKKIMKNERGRKCRKR